MPKGLLDHHLAAMVTPAIMFLVIIFLAPLLFVIAQSVQGQEPFWQVYMSLIESRLFRRVYLTTLEISLTVSIISIACAFPIALHISQVSPDRRPLWALFVLLPFWTSILVKTYAFIIVLGHNGLLNNFLAAIGFPRGEFIFNRIGVILGMTHFFIPFAVFPILSNLLGHDQNLRKAAEMMGANKSSIFWNITFPQSLSGVAAGFILTFVLSLGFFVTPALLGGRKDFMLANLIDFYTRQTLDWGAASAIGVILLITTVILLFGFRSLQKKIG